MKKKRIHITCSNAGVVRIESLYRENIQWKENKEEKESKGRNYQKETELMKKTNNIRR
jgi:hypothetical protein